MKRFVLIAVVDARFKGEQKKVGKYEQYKKF